MSNRLEIAESGVHIVLDIAEGAPVRLLHFGAAPLQDFPLTDERAWAYRLVELRVSGADHDYVEAGRYAGSGIGAHLRYVSHSDERVAEGRRLRIYQRDPVTGIEVTSTILLSDGCAECATRVVNAGTAPFVIEAVSSFFLVGVTKEGSWPRGLRAAIHTPRNGWYAEFQWTSAVASDLGLNNRFDFGSRHETISSADSWCSSNYLPMGYLENRETGTGLMWEILHSGAWSWQVGEAAGELYLHIAGPTERESNWWQTLQPGEVFEAVPVVLAPSRTGFDESLAALVRHRRRGVSPEMPRPVVFNDYMNCLMGDPTEEKVMPLIARASRIGAEVYCMDSGWYAEPGAHWADSLGNWAENAERFPNGLASVMDKIRQAGMIPGIWFEIEAMTSSYSGFADLPDDWFFCRHGKRVQSHARFQLDFRNPEVRAFADQAIDGAVNGLGCGYLKLDYNFSVNGSDLTDESPGGALHAYNIAFLDWLDGVRRRHPHLLLEHCASGGQRLARPMLDRTNLASSSDEGCPLQVARIAAAAPTILLPEQNGTWALPEASQSPEEIAFAMLCAIPYRMIVAGGLLGLSEEQLEIVAQAVKVHKNVRDDLARAVPSWPLGLPGYHDAWICAALSTPCAMFLVIWRRKGGPDRLDIPLPSTAGSAKLLYPTAQVDSWRRERDTFSIELKEGAGRLFLLDLPSAS